MEATSKLTGFGRCTDLALIVILLLGCCAPAISDAAERVKAVASITDQSVLAKLAEEDADDSVRKAAVEKLTDQTALAKIAEANVYDVRMTAVERLTDQSLLAEVAERLDDFDSVLGAAVVAKLTDQGLLSRVAKTAANPDVAAKAVLKLADQSVLQEVASTASNIAARMQAVAQLTNRATLTGLTQSGNDHISQIAQLRLFLISPIVEDQLGVTKIEISRWVTHRGYVQGTFLGLPPSNREFDVSGESGWVTVSGGKLTRKSLLSWETEFPETASRDTKFIPAILSIEPLVAEVLTDFPQASLSKIATDDDGADVRMAAVGFLLTDQALLAKVAVQDKDASVRQAAVANLADQTLLAKIAVADESPAVREAAVGSLTDQALLTKISAGDKVDGVRQAAKDRLAALAKGGTK